MRPYTEGAHRKFQQKSVAADFADNADGRNLAFVSRYAPITRFGVEHVQEVRSMRALLVVLAFTLTLFADDPHCPAYPASQRQSDRIRLKNESQAQAFSIQSRPPVQKHYLTSSNYIDDFVFGKMAADGVPSAPLSDDS